MCAGDPCPGQSIYSPSIFGSRLGNLWKAQPVICAWVRPGDCVYSSGKLSHQVSMKKLLADGFGNGYGVEK